MKIQLVQPKLGEHRMKNGRDMMIFPLSLAAIGTYVKKNNPDTDIELLDAEFEDNLEDKLDGDIIGFSPTILNFDQELLDKLHRRGQTVVIGGVHSSQSSAELIKLPYVDYICLGDGERTLLELSCGVDPEEIKGLTTKKRPGEFQQICIEELPIVDRSMFNQNLYMCNSSLFFETYLPQRPFRRMTNIYTNKGCRWRYKTGGCYFCGRMYKKLMIRSPHKIWTEIRYLVEEFGADFLWDVSDSFTSDIDWVKEMVVSKPADLNPYWYIYSRTDELLNDEMIPLLKKLNVYQVLVGVETGTNKMSEAISKGNSTQNNLIVARRLKDFNIRMLPSFIVGLPDEDRQSLQATYEHAQEIVKINQSEELSVSMLIPLPGSRAYKELKQIYFEKNGASLKILCDGEELQKLWFKYKCNTSFDTAVSYMFKLLDLTPIKSTFGAPFLQIDSRMPNWNQLSSIKRREMFKCSSSRLSSSNCHGV